MATKSQQNAQNCRDFTKTLHKTPYPALLNPPDNLPKEYTICILGGHGAAGTGLAKAYTQAGATGIILASRTLSALEETAIQLRTINPNIKIVIVECDISSNSAVQQMAHTAAREFNSRLDVVIVNAGFSGPMGTDIVAEKPEWFESALGVNTLGTFYAAHYLIPMLLREGTGTGDDIGSCGGGSFIAISSMAAPTVSGFGAHAHYCVSKAAQARLVEMVYEHIE
ncbi:hypothetical protein PENANT_c008G04533 [Penicillium antarcticum]|uniref:Ketoreductase (KR) domain-containing protein n=1 Tax=Penicillium antarcticum TaxID=416450 RepID=A0A1V6QAG7_9EURO|nr:hypothetical protein PENANT_c008G04533 [Penicillium antarcticum]